MQQNKFLTFTGSPSDLSSLGFTPVRYPDNKELFYVKESEESVLRIEIGSKHVSVFISTLVRNHEALYKALGSAIINDFDFNKAVEETEMLDRGLPGHFLAYFDQENRKLYFSKPQEYLDKQQHELLKVADKERFHKDSEYKAMLLGLNPSIKGWQEFLIPASLTQALIVLLAHGKLSLRDDEFEHINE